ncbi:PAS domain S-box protein [Natronorubrum sp. JWXQ-INN-674]|uniref:histidine kinase n=1 Tax=Natronorubrum halalkaliphilum TaxID=2691917 RepID=A0A6B0VQ98_9EURY|nr:PAS domain S-box protein [Natronorubrum halalkaliphilum]MXV62952.1 PAS domain S-box protein [Natronorubrum halalkaliphilum]
MAAPSVRGPSVGRVADRRLPLIAFAMVVLVLAVIRWPDAVSSTVALPVAGASLPAEIGPLPLLLGLAASGGHDRDADLERLAADLEAFVSDHCPTESDGDGSERTSRFDLERDDDVGRLATAVDELARTCEAREDRLAERERELRRSERRFAAVFDDPKMLGALLEPDGTVRRVNEAAFDYVDADRESVIGERFEETPWWVNTSTAAVREWIARAADGEYVEYEASLDDPDGTRAWVTGTFRPVRTEDGEVDSIVVSGRDITDRKERERRLETTAARLEALYEHSPDMIDVLDENGTILDANSRLCEKLGHEKEELIGTKIWIYDQRVDAAAVATLLEGMAVGERRRFEGEYRRADDSTFPVEIHLIRLDIDGENRYVAISRDITEQDERERELRERERELQRYRAYTDDVLDAIDDVFYVFDRDGGLQRWNETLSAVTGYTDAEIASMNALEFFEGGDQAVVEAAIQEVFEGGESRVEAQMATSDGDRIPYEFVATRLEDLEGNSVVAGIGRDISERRARERELERYREFTDDVLDAIDDMFYVLGADGEMIRWNETVPAVSGYTDEEIASMNAADFFPEDEQPAIRRSIEEAFETGTTQVEAEYLTKAGERIPYEFVATVLEDPDGTLVEVGIGRDISDRKERETELRERERQLSTLMSNVPGMVYRSQNEPDWPFEFVSEGSAEVTGYDPEALVDGDVNWADDVLLEDHDELWETVQEALTERDSFQVTYPIETADGERRWLSERGRGVYGADGSVEALEGVITDVTDRVDNERELEQTTRLLEQAEQLANVGAWVIDVRTEPSELQWTDEVARIHGLSPDAEIDLETALEYYHPENRARVRRAVDRAVNAGEAYDLELRLVPADGGDTRWVRTIGNPVQENGEVVKIYGSLQDITERKRRERDLERYETIIQAIGDPVYTLDASGDFHFVNDAIESLAGYDPETLIGTNISEVLRPDDLETARELVRALRRDEETDGTFEMELETADGDVLEAENHMALLPAEEGGFAGVAGVVRDITERKERERDLERTTDLLERVQRLAAVGGWELDVRTEPPEATWTEEMYRLHDLSERVTPTLETTVNCYLPEDRPFVRERLERAVETETGYDLEARLEVDDGDHRWVRAIGEPIFDDGSVIKYRGAVEDISDRKRRELRLESLHETARDLLNAETESAIAELVVETAEDLLESTGASVYLLDTEANRFEPTAATPTFVDRTGGPPSIAVGDADSVLWNTYVTGTQTVVDDAEIGSRSPLFGGDVPGGLLVPIGDHGVFALVAQPETIGEGTRQLLETLVATTEAAFDRLESEASLRERDAELEAQNRRLRRQIQVTEIIRGIDRSLIGADSREEIERTVLDRLVEADNVAFAWIGDVDASGTVLEPRTWAGSDPEYLDAVSLDLDVDRPEPSVRTARAETATVVENPVEGLKAEPWRTNALDAGFQSVVSVPLSFEEYGYGVLSVYADEPDAFTDLERSVFAELGEGIANAINATETREALHAETLVELTLRLEADDDILSRIATMTGATVTYEGLGTQSGSETVLFFETRDVSPEEVRETLADLVSVTDSRLITESDDGCLFEATVTGEIVASRLVRHGGSPRSIRADGTGIDVTVDVPTTTDVREFVEMLADQYERVDLSARQHVQRAMHTRQELVTSLFDDLTDRQLEVLRTAYLAGFFEWPRESTGEEIAEMLAVTQPTVNRHLRIGQQRLLAQLFGGETLSIADAS